MVFAKKMLPAAMLLTFLNVPAFSLNLTEACVAALAQDATLKAAQATTLVGHEGGEQARGQLLPNISASVSRSNVDLLSRTPGFSGSVSELSYSYPSKNDTVLLRQPIYRKSLWAAYLQAQAQVNEADATLDGELQNLAIRVSSAYFDALLAQDELVLMSRQVVIFQAHVDAAKSLLAAGSGIRTDVDEAQARLDMSRAHELEARQNLDYLQQKLRVIINQPIDKLAPLDPAALSLQPPAQEQFESWLRRAENTSPDLKILQARVEIAAQEIQKAKAGHLPTLDAVMQWSRSSSENNLSVNSSYEQHSIGLQLNIPIFSGGATSSVIRQALANKDRADYTLEANKRDLGVRVYKEFRGVTEGVLRIQAFEQALKSAEQVLTSSQKSFQAGSRTRLDVLNAETKKMQATQDLSQARYMYLLSQLRLQALTNEATIESVEAINRTLVRNDSTHGSVN